MSILDDISNQYCKQIKVLEIKNEDLQAENKRLKEEARWIPVSEKLPERGEFCDLYMPEFNSNCPQRGWYLSNDKVWLTTTRGRCRTRKVTHWKPIILPEQALQKKGGG